MKMPPELTPPELWYTLEPHSAPWFELLMFVEPTIAMHTMAIIAASGGDEKLCGICGDTPTQDYPDLNRHRLLFRLCDDCHEIRTINYGERYAEPGSNR